MNLMMNWDRSLARANRVLTPRLGFTPGSRLDDILFVLETSRWIMP